MPKLKLLQENFKQALFQDKPMPSHTHFIQSDYPNERLNIYKQTIIQNLRQALEITYPGVWVLLGRECADSVAYAYIKNQDNLPISGCLDEWGESFVDFLDKQPELETLPYLKDYAHYEWLKHLAYGQADSDFFTYDDLTKLTEHELANAIFYFQPSVYLMQSAFPLDNILTIIENPDSETFQLTQENRHILIVRSEHQVITYWITQEYYLFFNYLKQELSLEKAIHKIEENYPEFNLAEILIFLINNKLISKKAVMPT